MPHENVFNISAGQPFAKILAQYLLERTKDSPESLSSFQIFLPTRRACRVVREAFLNETQGHALLLPRLQPIGDIDEEELALSSSYGDLTLALPPAMPSLKRQILLARLIEKRPDFTQGFDQALNLAKALGHFIDQVYTENLKMEDLIELVPEELADHWQITLEFLKILSDVWPNILKEEGAIDAADRRNRLILTLNEHWQHAPPQNPVIAAGTTGSIPATRALLKTISKLPQGEIILPGLDSLCDDESWKALDENHPQYGFKILLQHLGIEKHTIKTLNTDSTPRENLVREIMRPAETTSQWMNLTQNDFTRAFDDLALYTAKNEHQEAEIIALLLREALETKDQKACLITPDRTLAKRVKALCRRWNIDVDDSAGESLKNTDLGRYLLSIADLVLNGYKPLDLLTFAKNPFALFKNAAALDRALRGLKPKLGIEGLRSHILNNRDINEEDKNSALQTLEQIEKQLKPIEETISTNPDFTKFLKTLLDTAEQNAQPHNLWDTQDGRQAAQFFAGLFEQTHLITTPDTHDFSAILKNLMDGLTLRPAYGTHPRLQILGQLEARLIDCDLVILSGLNEGTWPEDGKHDPWMSRPMRKTFGLPSPERSIGLSAHDFVQGFCAQKTILTRAEKKNGTPTVPARWLQRLQAVIDASGIKTPVHFSSQKTKIWQEHMDSSDQVTPTQRPEPCPPIDARPSRLSVTKIEKWLQDPYSLYAEQILKLKKLEELEQSVDARIKGNILHKTLEEFIENNKTQWPENAQHKFLETTKKHIAEEIHSPDDVELWQARLHKIASWFVQHEFEHRQNAAPFKTEIKGELKIGNFTLSGIADRIDKSANGLTIIDYKSGGAFSKSKLQDAEYPQMPLEALMLRKGAFKDIKDNPVGGMEYWVINGSGVGGKVTAAQIPDDNWIDDIEEKLNTLLETFSQAETPYICMPRADKIPRFNDFLHLARLQEWAVLGDTETESEAA